MSKPDAASGNTLFGEAIFTYTRAQALADGVLVEVTAMAREAGFQWPVAMTAAAWQDCVAWSGTDNAAQTYQDESGRLWDVLFMAAHAVRRQRTGGRSLQFELERIPRDGKSRAPRRVALKLETGPGDAGEPVVTILLPDED